LCKTFDNKKNQLITVYDGTKIVTEILTFLNMKLYRTNII